MTELAVECINVRKSYKRFEALRGLDLSIPRGSVFGLLGKNGAGKTTLIKCMMGLISHQSGNISVLNGTSNLNDKLKTRIGYVPQKPDLYDWMSVQEIIDYVSSFYFSWNTPIIMGLINKWELDPDVKIKALSGGELQQVAILLALGHEPELLVLDEPAASLDPIARREFLRTILDIVSEKECTVIFSTHITTDIERVADRVAIIQTGRTTFSGELSDLKETVKKLRIKAQKPLPNTITATADIKILSQNIKGKEAVLTVQGESDNFIETMKQMYGTETEVFELNLEDIFIELHK